MIQEHCEDLSLSFSLSLSLWEKFQSVVFFMCLIKYIIFGRPFILQLSEIVFELKVIDFLYKSCYSFKAVLHCEMGIEKYCIPSEYQCRHLKKIDDCITHFSTSLMFQKCDQRGQPKKYHLLPLAKKKKKKKKNGLTTLRKHFFRYF